MIHSLEIQSAYSLPLLCLIVELLLFAVLMNGLLWLRRKRKKIQMEEQGVAMYHKAVCEGMGEAHFLVERKDWKPVYFTKNFEEVVGLEPKRIQDDFEVLRKLMPEREYKKFIQKYVERTGDESIQVDYQMPTYKERWMRMIVIPGGQGEYDFFIFRDVTQEKQYQSALEGELEQAEEASRSKTTFLSRMSHEIRTPINGIIGMLSLAHAKVNKGSDMDGYLGKAENLSSHLIALVNDILDMSRIEAGKIELENKPFDVFALADKLRNMFQGTVEAKGVQFDVELLDFDTQFFVGDEFRLSQVIVNFLSNAVKFTQEGEIKVTFRQMLKENNKADLMIRVHDTGIGMQPEFVQRIFQPFEQESAEISKKYGGTGLGMAISDQIIRLMGGEIVIDSMPGRGSDFIVYLHLPVASKEELQSIEKKEKPQEYEDDYSFEGKRILMAEDNEINAEIAVEILENYGAKVDIAENGAVAVDKFAGNAPGYYDFILMDIQMPVLNGRDAARKIRQMEREDAKEILIFALSADAFVEDVRLSAEAGMNGHFAKPVEFDEVRRQIGQIVHMREGGQGR